MNKEINKMIQKITADYNGENYNELKDVPHFKRSKRDTCDLCDITNLNNMSFIKFEK